MSRAVPPMDRSAATRVAALVMDYSCDGLAVPSDVEKAADLWMHGRGGVSEWAVLYRWAIVTLDGANAGVLARAHSRGCP